MKHIKNVLFTLSLIFVGQALCDQLPSQGITEKHKLSSSQEERSVDTTKAVILGTGCLGAFIGVCGLLLKDEIDILKNTAKANRDAIRAVMRKTKARGSVALACCMTLAYIDHHYRRYSRHQKLVNSIDRNYTANKESQIATDKERESLSQSD